MVNVLILAPLLPQTGNYTTATRIRTYLENKTYSCFMLNPSEIKDNKLDLLRWCLEHEIRLIVALHALHCGRTYISNKLNTLGVPVLVILGGTDVNEAWKQRENMAIMTSFLQEAKLVIGFTTAMTEKSKTLWSFLVQKLNCRQIPQAITVLPSSRFSLQGRLRTEHSCYDSEAVCIMVSGIRPIKDPLHIMETFSKWRSTQTPSPVLVIIGPILDTDYGKEFKSQLKSASGVLFIAGLTLEETHAAIQQSFCLINSSISEGMSAAILEAMALGTPVIARANEGNISLIRHKQTGLIYESPQDCIRCISLLNETSLRREITERAISYVQSHHNPSQEANSYLKAISECIGA